MNEHDEYDPERALWRPGRRSFLFLMGAAAAGALLPGETVAEGAWQDFRLCPPIVVHTSETVLLRPTNMPNFWVLDDGVVQDPARILEPAWGVSLDRGAAPIKVRVKRPVIRGERLADAKPRVRAGGRE